MAGPLITLTTDYGTVDHLTGVLKGVIANINPEAHIYDITHQVTRHDVLDGALTVAQSYRYWPARTIHVVVVDPGVGTARRPILASAGGQFFIAPDNGVLSLVFEREKEVEVRHITAEHYFLHPVSRTFHGRDIFAPCAAWLSRNWQPESFGPVIEDYVRIALPQPEVATQGLRGVILRADHFGNLLTNLRPEDVPELQTGRAFRLRVGRGEARRVVDTFSEGEPGELCLFVGSSGFLELCVNRGSAAELAGAGAGTPFELEWL